MTPMFARQALALLERPVPSEELIRPGCWRPGPLVRDIERLSNPAVPLEPGAVASLLAKYFHAYVHEGSERVDVGLPEITLVFDQFANRRRGCVSLSGLPRLRSRLLKYTFALSMLADLVRTTRLFLHVAGARAETQGGSFVGLDIGTGTGVLLLATVIQARRNRCRELRAVGIERDGQVFERTRELCGALGFGELLLADAKEPAAYEPLKGEAITCVTNETIPGMNQRMFKEDFWCINRVLFDALGPELAGAAFYPEGLLVRDSRDERYAILCRENRFGHPDERWLRLSFSRGILIDGEIHSLSTLGSEHAGLFTPVGLRLLGRRW